MNQLQLNNLYLDMNTLFGQMRLFEQPSSHLERNILARRGAQINLYNTTYNEQNIIQYNQYNQYDEFYRYDEIDRYEINNENNDENNDADTEDNVLFFDMDDNDYPTDYEDN
jgi:hypothetical protein